MLRVDFIRKLEKAVEKSWHVCLRYSLINLIAYSYRLFDYSGSLIWTCPPKGYYNQELGIWKICIQLNFAFSSSVLLNVFALVLKLSSNFYRYFRD